MTIHVTLQSAFLFTHLRLLNICLEAERLDSKQKIGGTARLRQCCKKQHKQRIVPRALMTLAKYHLQLKRFAVQHLFVQCGLRTMLHFHS